MVLRHAVVLLTLCVSIGAFAKNTEYAREEACFAIFDPMAPLLRSQAVTDQLNENVFSAASELEQAILDAWRIIPAHLSPQLTQISDTLEILVTQMGVVDPISLLEQIDQLREQIEDLTSQTQTTLAPKSEQPQNARLQALVEAPTAVVADLEYLARENATIERVIFLKRAVAEIRDLETVIQAKFHRAILRGIVAPTGHQGVVRLAQFHAQYVEVKLIGGHTHRLLGCLNNGVLTIKVVFYKGSRGNPSHRYRDLCG